MLIGLTRKVYPLGLVVLGDDALSLRSQFVRAAMDLANSWECHHRTDGWLILSALFSRYIGHFAIMT